MENVLLLRFGFFCKEIQLQLFLEYGNSWHAALSRRDIFYKCNFEKVSFLYFFLLKSKSPPRNFLFATSEAEHLNCLKLWVTVAFLVQGGLWDSCPPVGLQSLGHAVVPLPWKIKKKRSCIYFGQFVTGFELKTDFALFPLQRTPATESCPTAKAG